MSMLGKIRAGAALVICGGLLAACGNDRGVSQNREALLEITGLVKTAVQNKLSGAPEAPAPDAVDPAQAVAAAMQAVPDVPLILAMMESSGATSVMGVYNVNGRDVTWVTQAKQTLTLRDGVLVATRGLGGDLMSLEEGSLVSLLKARRGGTVQKTYRFLDGEDNTARLPLTCQVEVQGREHVVSGEVSAQTTVMRETCETGGAPITNVYWVDGAGRVVQSFQWASSYVGNVIIRQLRF
ncbi:hypothetical protein AQS8620_00285 [Aquimixticola soesokkakensis]|uniref:Group 4 capsule polysaccharide lipoprotein gfcB, YjbF n=1 Tax=Aquimixticola soesokkakensis TaxID=1519096 RepID=A0A1Y5REL6_9RHOB|nr:YjbF family lipoprotein [Aquimixticola soesokkakensis]SLN15458.1 hypothetical protein AQS8620_00285 [Aquimixticola soesokkakensis]